MRQMYQKNGIQESPKLPSDVAGGENGYFSKRTIRRTCRGTGDVKSRRFLGQDGGILGGNALCGRRGREEWANNQPEPLGVEFLRSTVNAANVWASYISGGTPQTCGLSGTAPTRIIETGNVFFWNSQRKTSDSSNTLCNVFVPS